MWKNIPERYVKESVANVEKYLADLGDACWHFPKKKSYNLFVGDYYPGMDRTPDM